MTWTPSSHLKWVSPRSVSVEMIGLTVYPENLALWWYIILLQPPKLKSAKIISSSHIYVCHGMAIPYRTAEFKSSNTLVIAIWGSTDKFNSRQYYFRLYGSFWLLCTCEYISGYYVLASIFLVIMYARVFRFDLWSGRSRKCVQKNAPDPVISCCDRLVFHDYFSIEK